VYLHCINTLFNAIAIKRANITHLTQCGQVVSYLLDETHEIYTFIIIKEKKNTQEYEFEEHIELKVVSLEQMFRC